MKIPIFGMNASINREFIEKTFPKRRRIVSPESVSPTEGIRRTGMGSVWRRRIR